MPELLEVLEPAGAFARIEDWLAARGFFAAEREELVAEVFLGYGLSRAIRRGGQAPPPEPCAALPLAACGIGVAGRSPSPVGGFEIGAWEQTWTMAEYASAVDEVRAAIARGDVYQDNLVQHLQAPFVG